MRSIRGKLFVTYAALFLLVLILFGTGFTWFVRGFYLEAIRGRLAEETRLAGELLRPQLAGYAGKRGREEIDRYVKELGERTSARITLVAPDGTVLGDTAQDAMVMDNHLNRPEIRQAMTGKVGSALRLSHTVNEEMLYTAVSLDENGRLIGFIRLALPLSQLNQAIIRIRYGLLAGLFLVLLFTLGISLLLSTGLTQPLKQMADVSRKIAAGELSSRISVRNRDEIGALAGAINRMAESLQLHVQKVTEGRDRLEAILATMVEGIIVFDTDGRAVLANPAAERMLGLHKEGWYGRRDLEIVRSVELHEKIIAVSRDKVFLEHEISTIAPGEKVLHISLAPIRQRPQEKAGVIAVFHDITRLRRLEEMRADFAANVSHELRTPLTAIRGFAETLQDGAYNEPESALRFAQIIQREAERLNSLIEDVLKLSKIESGKTAIATEPVALSDVADEVLARLEGRLKGYKLALEIPAELPQIAGDKGLLVQALYNVVDNALKYTQAGGSLTVKALERQGEIYLTVADNGIGIPKEAQERIFERFYRVDRARSRRLGGTGLGLAIVKHIVDAHQGRLKLESEEGKGTAITLVLPLTQK